MLLPAPHRKLSSGIKIHCILPDSAASAPHSQPELLLSNAFQDTKSAQQPSGLFVCSCGPIIRAEDIEENLYAAIDVVYDKLNKQLRKYKKRLQDRHQSNESIRFDAIEDIEENDYSSNEDNLDIVIKRTKKFGVKPMSPEEAVLQMDLSEHDFYMFRNSESNGISIVYRRKNGGYGLIESE